MIWMKTYHVRYCNSQMIHKSVEHFKIDTDKETLQGDLTKLVKWSENWQCYFLWKSKCINIEVQAKDTLCGIFD